MNKNRIFLVSMIAVTALLFLMRMTGLMPHIIISVVGLAIMIPFTAKTRAQWKKPALELIMRAMYLIAVVSGGMLMGLQGMAALGIVHKACAAIFLILLLVLYIPNREK